MSTLVAVIKSLLAALSDLTNYLVNKFCLVAEVVNQYQLCVTVSCFQKNLY